MELNYIQGPEVRFTLKDKIFIDVEVFGSDEKYEGLLPHRLFPISGHDKYISLVDDNGDEKLIVRNIDDLLPESKQVLQQALKEFYRIPKITKFVKREEKFLIWMWTCDTDMGTVTFEIRNSFASIKTLYDGRILIKDGSDNLYEIPDLNALDKRSIKLLTPEL